MSLYLQYHNCDKRGLTYLLSPGDQRSISTRRPNVTHAQGTVFLIAVVGRPRQVFLWEAFDIESVDEDEVGNYSVRGPGWQLSPPQRLVGPDFEAFKDSCGKFVAFCKIDDLPYSATLKKLAKQYRAACPVIVKQSFLQELLSLLKVGTDDHAMVVTLLKRQSVEPKSLERTGARPKAKKEIPVPKLVAPTRTPTKERPLPHQNGEANDHPQVLSKVRPGPALHPSLPQLLKDRVRTVHKIIGAYLKMSLEEFEVSFRRDARPDGKVAIWCGIASAWLSYHDQFMGDKLLPDAEEKQLLSALIQISSGMEDPAAFSVPPETVTKLIACYRGWSQSETARQNL